MGYPALWKFLFGTGNKLQQKILPFGNSIPKANSGSGSTGTSTEPARADHVHPAQTAVTGNAATASKLQTARTIKLTGDATGSGSFDGSKDLSIATTVATMKAATADAAGTKGLVPAPAAGAQGKYLRGDGTWQTPTNTDTKVTQTVTTTNDDYPILTTATADATATKTEGARFSTKIKANPSTGVITATSFNGAVSGNASTASSAAKLTTARSVRVNLASTSAVNFDGSANITPGVTGTLGTGNGGTGRTDGKVAALATARTIDGVQFNGSANITHYGTCSTAAGTAAKTVTLANFALVTGATVWVKFTAANTHASPTLNVNGTGAKSIRYLNAALPDGMLQANGIYQCIYDGTYWQLVSGGSSLATIDPWDIFPMYVPISVFGVKFGGSDGRRAIMPGESTARENWIKCDGGADGKGGTVPNLQGRFILGADDKHKAGSTGGSEEHSHSLSGTTEPTTLTAEQLASHDHTAKMVHREGGTVAPWSIQGDDIWGIFDGGYIGTSGGSQPHAHGMTGSTSDESSLPPFLALPMIMRVS